jgi:hypothetical protein
MDLPDEVIRGRVAARMQKRILMIGRVNVWSLEDCGDVFLPQHILDHYENDPWKYVTKIHECDLCGWFYEEVKNCRNYRFHSVAGNEELTTFDQAEIEEWLRDNFYP